MTIEEKARAYDEALARANELYNNRGYTSITGEIFPELKESEDEKILVIIKHCIESRYLYTSTIQGISLKQCFAWLEKQGEHANFRNKIQVGDKVTRNEDGVLVNLSQLERVAKPREKQGEQKASYTTIVETGDGGINALVTRELPTDGEQKSAGKDKPKFKAGDWITNGRYIRLIVNINSDWAYYMFKDGTSKWIKDIDKKYRLWTIQDAKDGDVLVDEDTNLIGIFEGIEGMCWHSKFYYSNFTKEFYGIECGGSHLKEFAKPATKEQRDTLMKAMADAGYTFDFENKKLKKIEPKPEENKGNVGGISANWIEDEDMVDEIIVDIEVLKEQERTKDGKALYQKEIDWLIALKEKMQPQPKQEWNEEDECYMTECINAIATKDGWSFEEKRKTKHWLKSLQYRVQPQPKQEWSEEDKYMYDILCGTIENTDINENTKYKLISWLKSLRPQNTWKPSDEQMWCLSDAIEHYNSSGYPAPKLKELLDDLKKLKEE